MVIRWPDLRARIRRVISCMLGRANPLAKAGELAGHGRQCQHLQNLSPIMTLICH
jgi:hypothetical protein